jgi:uncharacterized protein YcfL
MKQILLIIGTVIFLTGCQGPYAPRVRNDATPQFSQKITYLDKALTRRLLLSNHKAYRESDGRMTVKCAFENRTSQDIWVDIQVVFYDEDHFEVDQSNWQPTCFYAKTVSEVAVNSLNDQAFDYAILVRECISGMGARN